MIGDLPYLLAHEVEPWLADAAISIPVVVGVFGASGADSSDLNIASLAEAHVFVEVFVLAAFRSHKGTAGLIGKVIDFVDLALVASTVDAIISKSTDAFLISG